MTFEELLADGEHRLWEERTQRAAASATAKAQADAKREAFLSDLRAGIEALVPVAVQPFLSCPVDSLFDWSYQVMIEAPGCAPVRCEYITGQKRFNAEKPFCVPSVQGGFLDDWGEGVPPGYEWAARYAFFTEDLALALAVARERYSEMQGRQADFERRKAEVEAAVAVKMEAEVPAAAGPAAVRGQTQEPSLAEQLAGLIRVIVRQELDAAAGCAWGDGMDEATREWRRRKFRVSAQPGRFDSELLEVSFDTGTQSVTVVGLLPDEWWQVVDVVEQALRAAEGGGEEEEEELRPCPVCEGRGMVNWLSD